MINACIAYRGDLVVQGLTFSLTFSVADLGVRDVYHLVSGLVIARVAQCVLDMSYGAFGLY